MLILVQIHGFVLTFPRLSLMYLSIFPLKKYEDTNFRCSIVHSVCFPTFCFNFEYKIIGVCVHWLWFESLEQTSQMNISFFIITKDNCFQWNYSRLPLNESNYFRGYFKIRLNSKNTNEIDTWFIWFRLYSH